MVSRGRSQITLITDHFTINQLVDTSLSSQVDSDFFI